jgi:hypothetical protein
LTGGQVVGSFAGLGVNHRFVVPAGSYLVQRHRARSSLAPEHPCTSDRFNVAERWGWHLDAARALGHLFISRQAMAGTEVEGRDRHLLARHLVLPA